MEYVQWLVEVDSILTDLYGVGHRDLVDYDWVGMFEDAITPQAVVEVFATETD